MSSLSLPPEDRTLSPFTGYTREHWAAAADQLLLALRPYFSSTRARILPPGRFSRSGPDSDGLEGFARSFELVAYRIVGENGDDPHGFIDWYRDGLIAGVDPANPERWQPLSVIGQGKVEAASIAIGLQLTREWLWDTLDPVAQANVITWFSEVTGSFYGANNWYWFQIVVETFLATVDPDYDAPDIAGRLVELETYFCEHGWYVDGLGHSSFDNYCGWAMEFYPMLWAGWETAERFGSKAVESLWRERLSDYLDDHISLIGGDGTQVMQGRSLVYRFATVAPLWLGAATGATTLTPGAIRRSASGTLRSFLDRGVPDERGLLTLGLFEEWEGVAQRYSGSGSPYWAAKGMYGLALPASHPVWTSVEEPLPVELDDTTNVIAAPGWLVSGTKADGIVRVVNYGTDKSAPGNFHADIPLYARLGYSSATIPPVVGEGVESPVDSSVSIVDAAGRASHRTGFTPELVADEGTALRGVATVQPHWPADESTGPRLATASLVHGAWEVRLVRVLDQVVEPLRLRFSGWPLATKHPDTIQSSTSVDRATTAADSLTSTLVVLSGLTEVEPRIHTETDVSPLGVDTLVPWIDGTFAPAGVAAVAVCLTGVDVTAPPTFAVVGDEIQVTWPDGTQWRGDAFSAQDSRVSE